MGYGHNAGCAWLAAQCLRNVGLLVCSVLLLAMPVAALPFSDMTTGTSGPPFNPSYMADEGDRSSRSVNAVGPGAEIYLSNKRGYDVDFVKHGIVEGKRPKNDDRGAVLIMETVNTCVNFSHINLTTPSGSVEHSENQRRNCPVRIMSKNKERILCMDKKGNVHHKDFQRYSKSKWCHFIEEWKPGIHYFGYYSYYIYKRLANENGTCTRRPNKKNLENPCKWYIVMMKNGKIRQGRRADGSSDGAKFTKVDVKERIMAGSGPTQPFSSIHLTPKSKETSISKRKHKGGKRRGRKRGRNKAETNDGRESPFSTQDHKRRHHHGSTGKRRNTKSRQRNKDDSDPFGQSAGNPRSGGGQRLLSVMRLTSHSFPKKSR